MMRLIDSMKIAAITLESEGITDDILDYVDLDVEYSPVVPIPGDDHRFTSEAIKTQSGQYLLNPPCPFHGPSYAFNEREMKIMRARYLLRLKEDQARQFAPLFKKLRSK